MSKHQKQRTTLAIAAAMAMLWLTPIRGQVSKLPDGVYRVTIPEPPQHTISGVIRTTDSDSVNFLVLSAPDGTLLEYRYDLGDANPRIEKIGSVGREELGFSKKAGRKHGGTQIAKHGSTFTLSNPLAQLSQVYIGDSNKNIEGSIRVLGEAALLSGDSADFRPQINNLWSWSTDGATVLAFGDIVRKASGQGRHDQWSGAFFEIAVGGGGEYKIFREIALTNPARNYYMYVPGLFTAVDGYHYYIDMERPPAIYKYSPWGERELLAVFGGILAAPRVLPGGIGSEELHKELHLSSYPAGVFPASSEGSAGLLLLSHHGGDTGPTWQMTHIDTSTKQTVDYIIPSKAEHVLLLPGKDFIVVIEQVDQVEKLGADGKQTFVNQKALSALIIPVGRLSSLEVAQENWSLNFQ